MQEYTEQDVLNRLKEYAKEIGSPAEAARQLGITPQYIGDILHGNRGISEAIANKLGYRKVTVFYVIDQAPS